MRGLHVSDLPPFMSSGVDLAQSVWLLEARMVYFKLARLHFYVGLTYLRWRDHLFSGCHFLFRVTYLRIERRVIRFINYFMTSYTMIVVVIMIVIVIVIVVVIVIAVVSLLKVFAGTVYSRNQFKETFINFVIFQTGKGLQSRQVKLTPLDYINELIIWKLNPFVVPNSVRNVRIKSRLLLLFYSRENLQESSPGNLFFLCHVHE